MIKPYYTEPGIELYCGDCRDILPQLPKVDLVLTDPPYNCEYGYDNYSDNLSEKEYLDLLKVITRPAVTIHYPEQTINLLPKILGTADEVVAWVYNNPIPVPKDFRLIAWWGCQPDFTLVREPYSDATLTDKRAIGKLKDGRGIRDWWMLSQVRYPAKENTDHPCQIPEEAIRRILATLKADTILDPFCGSGTTLVAAKQLGRKAIGIEISEKYVQIAIKRLGQEYLL